MRQADLMPDEEEREIDPFIEYGSEVAKMLGDTNLIAQAEGITTLYNFICFADQIKTACHSAVPLLLDEINHNKPATAGLIHKIFEKMIRRDQASFCFTELIQRIRNLKKPKNSVLAIKILTRAIVSYDKMEFLKLKELFKVIVKVLKHPKQELRDAGLDLLKELFKRTEDTVEELMVHLSSLRAVYKREIQESLLDLGKVDGSESYRIFSASNAVEESMIDETPTQEKRKGRKAEESGPLELKTVVDDEFYKIDYVKVVKEKAEILSKLNEKLEEAVSSNR